MDPRTLVGIAACIAFAAISADAASCRVGKNHNCFNVPAALDFNAVPEITRQLVSREPQPPKQRTSVLEASPITTYTGPTVGVSSLAHAPTVGYYWSLEPDNSK